MSLGDIVSKRTNGSECIETTSTCKKHIYLQKTTDDPSMFEFFIDGIYQKVKNLQVQAKKYELPNADLYVNLNTKLMGDQKTTDLMSPVSQFFKDDAESVLVITGSSGAGKSMFLVQLYKKLWKEYKPGQPFPLLIELNQFVNDISQGSLIEAYFSKKGFSIDEQTKIKNNHDIVLLLDGYDETGLKLQIYHKNHLGAWAKKVIFSVRDEYQAALSEFTPYNINGPQYTKNLELTIEPFNNNQIDTYLKKFSNNKIAKWRDWGKYRKYLNDCNLESMINNPFMLYMIADILPDVVEDNKEDLEGFEIKKIDIFKKFTKRYFERNNNKLRLSCINAIDIGKYEGFASTLASEMLRKGINAVEYKHKSKSRFSSNFTNLSMQAAPRDGGNWKRFFNEDDAELCNIRRGIPLRNFGANSWGFIHKSLLEYFCCIHLLKDVLHDDMKIDDEKLNYVDDSAAVEEFWKDLPDLLNFIAKKATPDETKFNWLKPSINNGIDLSAFNSTSWLKPFINKNIDFAPLKLISTTHNFHKSRLNIKNKLLNDEPAILKLLAQIIESNLPFEEKLWKYIMASKTNKKVSIAAANAMTILNIAGIPFSGVDLSNIQVSTFVDNQWQGPNITGGIFGGTNFTNADLRGSIMFGSWYQKANFTNAKLDAADLGIAERTFKGHNSSVSSVSFSSDGKFIASGSLDSTVKLWEISTGKLIKDFKGHNSDVFSVSFSSDGKFIASGSYDHTVKLWEVSTGKLIKDFKGHNSDVFSVSFSSDGKFIASGSYDHTVKLWEVSTGKLIKDFQGHNSSVSSVSFSSDGKFIASGSYDHTVKLWEVSTGKLIKDFQGQNSFVNSVSFSSDGKFIASGSPDSTVKLWEVSTGKLIKDFQGHNSSVSSVSFSSDGKFIASGSKDSTVKLWEVSTGKLIKDFKGHNDSVSSVSFSSDGKFIASGSYDKTVKLWEVNTGKLIKDFKGHNSYVSSVSFSSDGKFIASGSGDSTVKLWEVNTGKLIKDFKGHNSYVSSVSFSSDGKFIASGSGDSTVKLWEVISTGRLIKDFKGHNSFVNSVSFSSDGKFIASGSGDSTVKLWEVSTDKLIKDFKGHNSYVSSVSFSSDGKFIASGSYDKTVKLWEVSTGKLIKDFKGHNSYVSSVSFSSDGKFIASGSGDSTVKLWEVSTGKLIKDFKGHNDYIYSVSFSSDGKFIASGSGR